MSYRQKLIKRFFPSAANEFYKEMFNESISILKKQETEILNDPHSLAEGTDVPLLIKRLQYKTRTFLRPKPLREQFWVLVFFLVFFVLLMLISAAIISNLWAVSFLQYLSQVLILQLQAMD